MARTRLGQFGVGVEPYAGFVAKTAAVVSDPAALVPGNVLVTLPVRCEATATVPGSATVTVDTDVA